MEATQLQAHLADQNSQLKIFAKFFWHRYRSETVVHCLRKYDSTLSVLDIGAGAGVFGQHLAQLLPSSKYFFIEPIQSLNESLKLRFGEDSAVTPEDTFSQASFVMLDVLEHIENDLAYLGELKRKVPSQSILIITCPANAALWSKWDEQMGHFRRYSRESLREVCQSAGFEVLESRYLFHAFVLPAFFRSKTAAAGPEFPRIPTFLNLVIFWYCKIEGVFSRWIPFGTSTLVVARKR